MPLDRLLSPLKLSVFNGKIKFSVIFLQTLGIITKKVKKRSPLSGKWEVYNKYCLLIIAVMIKRVLSRTRHISWLPCASGLQMKLVYFEKIYMGPLYTFRKLLVIIE